MLRMAIYMRFALIIFFCKQKFSGGWMKGKNVGLPLGGAVSV